MAISGYIKDKQPFIYRTFCNALKEGKLAHAYFISGEIGTPLKETAIYLAKSLLCDHPRPLADEECITCERIDKGEYPDFIFLDGAEETIKKDDIRALTTAFSRTALEAKGRMVYVINHVENMKNDVSNSLLKFLEEPPSETYAILTSQNEAKVLPTILSRCESLRLLLAPRKEVIEEAKALGVPQEDAEILSHFINDASLLKRKMEEEDYESVKLCLMDFLEALPSSRRYARFLIEKDVIAIVKTKPQLRMFFDTLTLFLKEALAYKTGGSIYLEAYATILKELGDKLPNLEESLLEVMSMRSEIETNINRGLLLIHLANVLCKE